LISVVDHGGYIEECIEVGGKGNSRGRGDLAGIEEEELLRGAIGEVFAQVEESE
jgi:hypothetical protein